MKIEITEEEKKLILQLLARAKRREELPKKEFKLIENLIKKII